LLSKIPPVQALAAMLRNSTAIPQIVPSRLAPSTIYDVEYRTAVIALVFERFARPVAPAEERKISSARLKFLQFLTLRPWLLPAIREWSSAGAQQELAFAHSIRIRRGFLSDSAHDDLISYLAACGILLRQETQIVSGKNARALTLVAQAIEQNDLFESERGVIDDLGGIKITNEMLEGW
jgi:hypothetical protein